MEGPKPSRSPLWTFGLVVVLKGIEARSFKAVGDGKYREIKVNLVVTERRGG